MSSGSAAQTLRAPAGKLCESPSPWLRRRCYAPRHLRAPAKSAASRRACGARTPPRGPGIGSGTRRTAPATPPRDDGRARARPMRISHRRESRTAASPSQILASGRGLGRAERGAVRRRRALHVRRPITDHGLAADQRRPIGGGARRFDRRDRIASGSWPSTFGTTCQPYASKRFGVSSVNQPLVAPSIEMPLSS